MGPWVCLKGGATRFIISAFSSDSFILMGILIPVSFADSLKPLEVWQHPEDCQQCLWHHHPLWPPDRIHRRWLWHPGSIPVYLVTDTQRLWMAYLGNWHDSMGKLKTSLYLMKLPTLWARSFLNLMGWLSESPPPMCWSWVWPTISRNLPSMMTSKWWSRCQRAFTRAFQAALVANTSPMTLTMTPNLRLRLRLFLPSVTTLSNFFPDRMMDLIKKQGGVPYRPYSLQGVRVPWTTSFSISKRERGRSPAFGEFMPSSVF